MPTTIQSDTSKMRMPAGLAQFLPRVPKTPPLSPRRTEAQAKRQRIASSTPAPARKRASAPQEQVMGETAESRRDKTLRLGQARMAQALRSIRLLQNLASRNYDWHEGEAERMEQVLHDGVTKAFAAFKKTPAPRLEEMFDISAISSGK